MPLPIKLALNIGKLVKNNSLKHSTSSFSLLHWRTSVRRNFSHSTHIPTNHSTALQLGFKSWFVIDWKMCKKCRIFRRTSVRHCDKEKVDGLGLNVKIPFGFSGLFFMTGTNFQELICISSKIFAGTGKSLSEALQNYFWMSETISVHNMFSPGLSWEFLCIELVIQWTICHHIAHWYMGI